MIKDVKLFNKIASALNSSFGTSGPGAAGLTFDSVKFELIDENTARAKCVQVVTFVDVKSVQSLIKQYEKETEERVKSACKLAKENFANLKDIEGVDKKSISLTMDTSLPVTSEVEFINVFSPVKRAFYKYSCIVKIS